MAYDDEPSVMDIRERAQAALDDARVISERIRERIAQSAELDVRSQAAASRAQAAVIRGARLAYRNDLIALRRTVAQLEEAMKTRAAIEQAKGILMARERCTPSAALDLLVRASQRENRKLHDIAQDIVDRTSKPPT